MARSKSIGSLFVALGLNDKKFKAGLKNAGSQLSAFNKFAGKYAGAGAAIAGASITAMAISASNSAANMEDLQVQLTTLTGSAGKAKDMIALFRKEAAKSALSTQDYTNSAKTMMAFGQSADEVIPIMRSLADISMGNSERFESLSLAFAQTTSAGRLMGQEVLQFVNAGFNPLQQISLKTGESMAMLKERMEDGAISASEVKQALIDATSAGGKFYKAIEAGSATTNAKIAQMKDQIETLKIAFGTGFNEGLRSALEGMSSYLSQFESTLKSLGESVANWVTGLVGIFADPTYFDLLVANMDLAAAKILALPGVKQLGGLFYAAQVGSMEGYNEVMRQQPLERAQRAVDTIYADIAKKAEQDAIAKDKARREEPAPVEIIAAPAMPQPAKKTKDQERIEIDSYAKRGLAMTSTPGSMQDKILKVQESIRDILKEAKIQDKQLVWQ